MTDPIKTLRCLVLDSIEGTLDCGLDMSKPADAHEFESNIKDLYLALTFLEQAVNLTYMERATLSNMVNFNIDAVDDDNPFFDMQIASNARAKLKG